MDILEIRIDNLEKKEILEKIEGLLAGDELRQIATINPEFILKAQKDEEYKNIINSCDLNVADGIGIKFAFWRYGEKLKARIAGADLFWEILRMANDGRLSVFLVANKNGLSSWEETVIAIKKIYPNIRIDGADLACNDSNENQKSKIKNQNIGNYNIIFCACGAPNQEKFLHSLKNQKNAKIRLAIGVGGSFDFATGKLHRAPLWMRKIGLEWLFRLIQQPKRIKRIFNAVIIFPIKVILS